MAVYKPGAEEAGTLILNFSASRTVKSQVAASGLFVTAAWADSYIPLNTLPFVSDFLAIVFYSSIWIFASLCFY